MPRRIIIRINVAELNVWKELWEELRNHSLFQEADFDPIEIVSKQRSLDARIIDVEMPIVRLARFIRNNGDRMVGKQKLCGIMKISRPTLNKWIEDEFILTENCLTKMRA